jgi:hypothetical protein
VSSRYWRIRVTDIATGSQFQATEVEMFDARGGANIATGGTPFGNGANPVNAFDGNTGTTYSADLPATIGYDFGAGNDKLLTHLIVRCSSANSGILTRFTIESSDDNSVWTVRASCTQTTTGASAVLYLEAIQPLLPDARVEGRLLALQAAQDPGWETTRDGSGETRERIFALGSGFVGDPGGPRNGAIAIFVREGGDPVDRAYVRVHRRRDGMLAAGGWTNAEGFIEFVGLDQSSDDHYVVAFDPDGGSVYNALVYDRVTPS